MFLSAIGFLTVLAFAIYLCACVVELVNCLDWRNTDSEPKKWAIIGGIISAALVVITIFVSWANTF